MTSRADLLGGLEREVGVLVRRVRRVIGERARLVHVDLQPAAFLILTYLAESGPQRASSLAGDFALDKGAVSRHVHHLADLGLVAKVPDPTDGRASLVSLTQVGRRRLEEVGRERRAGFDDRLSDWSDDDLAALVEQLGRYNTTLERRATPARTGEGGQVLPGRSG